MTTTAATFTAAVAKFFGRKEGQNLGEFRDELQKLTPQDREDLRVMLQVELKEDIAA